MSVEQWVISREEASQLCAAIISRQTPNMNEHENMHAVVSAVISASPYPRIAEALEGVVESAKCIHAENTVQIARPDGTWGSCDEMFGDYLCSVCESRASLAALKQEREG